MPGAKRVDGQSSKLRKGRWSKAEIGRLRELWGRRGEELIAREFNRSVENVRKTAESLFVDAPRRSGPWTAQDLKRLKESLGVTTPEVIAQVLGRPLDEVQLQIIELGRIQKAGRWTREEVLDLKRIYGRRSDEDLVKYFGRPIDSIRRQAQKLCLAKDKAFVKSRDGAGATRMPRWTAEELEQLKELYSHHSNLYIATALNRSVKSVVSKAHHLGLKKDPQRLKEMGRENVGLRYGKS